MILNHLKTDSAKFTHYSPKIQVIEFSEFQSLTQHPLSTYFHLPLPQHVYLFIISFENQATLTSKIVGSNLWGFTAYHLRTVVALMSQSVPTGYIPPRQPPGISSKTLPGGSGFDFWKLPGGREFDKGGDFVEIQSEIFCPCIGFISDKYRVSENC